MTAEEQGGSLLDRTRRYWQERIGKFFEDAEEWKQLLTDWTGDLPVPRPDDGGDDNDDDSGDGENQEGGNAANNGGEGGEGGDAGDAGEAGEPGEVGE